MTMILLLYKNTYFNTNELDSCVSSVYSSLLKEFNDVFHDEISRRLPHIKGIKYQIDLVPNSIISNRQIYRSNLEETKEFQRLVKEIMSKRYIQKNMSPCVVPYF